MKKKTRRGRGKATHEGELLRLCSYHHITPSSASSRRAFGYSFLYFSFVDHRIRGDGRDSHGIGKEVSWVGFVLNCTEWTESSVRMGLILFEVYC